VKELKEREKERTCSQVLNPWAMGLFDERRRGFLYVNALEDFDG